LICADRWRDTIRFPDEFVLNMNVSFAVFADGFGWDVNFLI
jgi:hypothetical protein